MSREEAHKLLGGYATGTLTAAEQEALFAAALEDQELFEAMVKEQPVRELLADPAARAELLASLDAGRQPWWRWRPLIAVVAMAGITMAVVGLWRAERAGKAPVMVAEVKKDARPAKAPGIFGTVPREAAPAPAAVPPAVAEKKARPASKAAVPRPAPVRRDANNVAEARAEAAPLQPPPAAAPRLPSPGIGGVDAGGHAPQFAAPQAISRALDEAAPQAAQSSKKSEKLTAATGAVPAGYAASAVRCTILRNGQDAAPDTLLDSGDTVQLRIVTGENGDIAVHENEKLLASGRVEKGKPFDTPALHFESAGPHELRVRLTGASATSETTFTLRYR